MIDHIQQLHKTPRDSSQFSLPYAEDNKNYCVWREGCFDIMKKAVDFDVDCALPVAYLEEGAIGMMPELFNRTSISPYV
jgi:hypothetical protein